MSNGRSPFALLFCDDIPQQQAGVIMRAHQIMTKGVIAVTPDTTIVEAAHIMLQRHISGLPVVNATGALVGIVSEGDFMRRVETGTQRKRSAFLHFLLGPGQSAADFVHSDGRKIAEIMTPNPVTISEDTTLQDIVRLMEQHGVKRLPVVRGDKVIGIVSRANLLQAVADLARDVPDPTADDDHIRDRILAALEATDWVPFGIGVTVRNGIVHIRGVITDERARQATIVAAENIAGFIAVHDHLCWVEPISGMYLASAEDEKAARAS